MSVTINNFIYKKKEALDHDFCDELISEFDSTYSFSQRNNKTSAFQQGDGLFPEGKMGRNDFQLFIPNVMAEKFGAIQDCIFEGLEEYQDAISSVKGILLTSPIAKLQKTPVGGGYSLWHIEQGAGTAANRSLVWSIYLNDVEDGGETEFLYQHQKIAPEKGSLLIWPAGITHPHRGNPPYSNEKYILTGWFEVAPSETYHAGLAFLKSQGG